MSNIAERHDAFEARNPDIAEYEQGLETLRQTRFLTSTGSLDGYEPRRAFPCLGFMRVTERFEAMEIVVCEVCGYETSRHPASSTARSEW